MKFNTYSLIIGICAIAPLVAKGGLIFNQSFDKGKSADYSTCNPVPIKFTGNLRYKPGYISRSAAIGKNGILDAVYYLKGIWQDECGTVGFSAKIGKNNKRLMLLALAGTSGKLEFYAEKGKVFVALKSKNGKCVMELPDPGADGKSGFKNYYFSWSGKHFNCSATRFGSLNFSPEFNFDKISIGQGCNVSGSYLLDEITVLDEWTPPSVNVRTFMNCTGWLTNAAADKVFNLLEEKVRTLRRKGMSVPYANIPLAVAGVVGIRVRHKLQSAALLEKYQKFVEKSCKDELARIAQIEAGNLVPNKLPESDYSKFSLKDKAIFDASGKPSLMFRIMYNPDVWFLRPFSDEFIFYVGRVSRKKIDFLLEREKFGVYASPADLVRQIPRDALGYALSSKAGAEYVDDIIKKLKTYQPLSASNLFLFNFLNFETGGGICYAKENIEAFTQWLKRKYDTIQLLNFSWGTNYKDFSKCKPPYWKRGLYKIYPDNRAAWGDWLEYMTMRNAQDYWKVKRDFDQALKPNVPVNYIDSSIETFANHAGVTCMDWEALAKINDIMVAENSMKTIPAPYAMEPFGTMQADFRTSLISNNKAVVNMEMHCGTFGALKFVDNYYACAILRDYLHGKSAIHLWQAMRPWGNSLFRGHSYTPTASTVLLHKRQTPEMLFNMYKATLDAKRLAETIVKFRLAPAKFALLFSDTSLRQLPVSEIFKARKWLGHEKSLREFYHALLPLGYRTGFLTENMIKAGNAGKYKAVILPGVSHLPAEVVRKLSEYVKNGGILIIGADSLLFDEHNRPVTYLASLLKRRGWKNSDGEVIPYEKVVTEKNFSDYMTLLNYRRETVSNRIRMKNNSANGVFNAFGGIAEIVEPRVKTEVVFEFDKSSGPLADKPALWKAALGKGQIYFFSTEIAPEAMAVVFEQIQNKFDAAEPVVRATCNGKLFVEGELRWIKEDNGKIYAYLINLLDHPVKAVKLEVKGNAVKYRNLMSGNTFNGTLDLKPLETVIIEISEIDKGFNDEK